MLPPPINIEVYLQNTYNRCCELSQSKYKHGKKDAYSLYNWIFHKQRSKAKEKNKKTNSNARSYIQSLNYIRVT